jgi:hypothetical protein
VAVADNRGHTGHARKLVRSALRVAAGDDNSCGGISAMRTTNECTSRAIGLSRYAASVDHDHVGCKWFALGKSAQTAGNGLAVGTRRTATEVLYLKAGHRFQFSKFHATERLAECKAGGLGLERISIEENKCGCPNNPRANSRANARESPVSLFA